MTIEFAKLTTELPTSSDWEPLSRGVEQAIAQASRYSDLGDLVNAEQAYLNADALLGSERSPRHAEVLVCLAMLLRKRGANGESSTLLDLALANFPGHRAALSQRLALAREVGDLAGAAALRSRMLDFCESAEARVHVLSEVVDDALAAAVAALEQAIELRPSETELRERLRSLLEATCDYEGAVSVAVTLAESLKEPKLRAKMLAQAAELCAKKSGNVERAVALYEAAIVDDPTVAGAFEAIEAVLIEVGDVDGTERAYLRQIERLQAGGHRREEAQLQQRLAQLREDQLADIPSAIAALERAISLCPDQVSARLALSRLLERQGNVSAALGQLEQIACATPQSAVPYREMQRMALDSNELDRAFFAASALVNLGEADDLEQAVYRRYAPIGAPSVGSPFTEASLVELRPCEHPARAILLAVHDAAVAVKLNQLKSSRTAAFVDERERQDPEQSTVSAIRVVNWTIKLLGLPAYALYTRPGQGFAISHPMTAAPSLLLGAGMLSGRTVPELLFRTAYELGAQRELGRLPVFYPGLSELATLLSAAVGLVQPQSLPSNAVDLSRALGQELTEAAKAKLAGMVGAAMEQHLTLDVARLLRDVEVTAGRIGLCACTDVTVAVRQVAIETRAIPSLLPQERMRDMLAYAVSDSHAKVRRLLGMAVGGTSKSIPA